jgi:MoxR-like ATPase
MSQEIEEAVSHASGNASAEDIAAAQEKIQELREALASVVMGQSRAISELVVGVLADGHILLEGIPGVAKTLLARSLATAMELSFQRVQFTPDLMPSDLLGTSIWSPESRTWEFHPGPIFTQILLGDEINRTPPKTQAALLEAMEENQVTIDGSAKRLEAPFLVIATENPLDFEGTYPLPEAQKDRFLLKILMAYPDAEAEKALLTRGRMESQTLLKTVPKVFDHQSLKGLRKLAEKIRVDESILDYLMRLLRATRDSPLIRLGASPRAGLMWLSVAKALAFVSNRHYVTPDDVKTMAPAVLRHRLALSTQAELDGLQPEDVLQEILNQVAIQSP